MDKPRKAPAVEKTVSQITEEDIRVRVIGTVKSPDESGFTLEDDTGSMRVETQDKLVEGARVRVFARPTKINDELVLSSELVQDVSGLDEKLYKKIQSQVVS